jgi:hypothetical protein
MDREGYCMKLSALLSLAVAISFIAVPFAQQPPSERIIDTDLRIQTPLVPCAVLGFVRRIAQSVRVPVGIEAVPESCDIERNVAFDSANEVSLNGLTVVDAFNKLAQLDPRYGWSDADGVLVIRPVLASSDPSHFLHQTLRSWNLTDERLGGALNAIQSALSGLPLARGDQYAMRTPEGERRFSVALNATSILEALNASVRAHGSMWWEVRYCLPAARYEYATITFYTFDGSGLGSHTAARRADGTTFDACRSSG